MLPLLLQLVELELGKHSYSRPPSHLLRFQRLLHLRHPLKGLPLVNDSFRLGPLSLPVDVPLPVFEYGIVLHGLFSFVPLHS